MNLEKTLKTYLEEISSSSPTPGGGNVAAFSGVLSCSLSIMVCNLTLGKKKYADVEQKIIETKKQLEDVMDSFNILADRDNEAFEKVMECFKMPKETDEQKSIRASKINEYTFKAAQVPYEVLKLSSRLPEYIKFIAESGNQNSISDAGVAASLCLTAAQGALLNVQINCGSLNTKESNDLLIESKEIFEVLRTAIQNILSLITNKL